LLLLKLCHLPEVAIEQPLLEHISVKSSFTFKLVVLSYHFLLMGTFWIAPLSIWWQCGATIVIVGSLFYICYRRIELSGIKKVLSLHKNGQWSLIVGEKEMGIEMDRAILISPLLTIIQFRDNRDKSHQIVLFADSMEKKQYRQLRVWVKTDHTPGNKRLK
jgi:hypothetical protein